MKKTKLYIVLSCLLLMFAISLVAYPLISNYTAEKYASTIRTEYYCAVAELADALARISASPVMLIPLALCVSLIWLSARVQ